MTNYLEQADWNKIDASTDAPAYVDYLARLDTTSRMQHYRQSFLQHLPCCPGERVVDAGCGIGGAVGALWDLVGKRGWVLGLDRSRHMVRKAGSQSHTGISFGAGDLCHLPLCSGSVDGIVCDRVLMHLERPLAALREMHRVLRPGGWLGLCEPDWSDVRMEPDGEVTRKLLEVHAASFANGAVGGRLDALASEVDFRVTQQVKQGQEMADYAWIRPAMNLDRSLRRVREMGVFSEDEMSCWQEQVESAARAGTFSLWVTRTICVGRRKEI